MAGTVDVEHEGLFLKHVLEDSSYPEIATIIKQAFDSVIPRKAIDFRTNVGRVIQQCLSMHGVPMFRTKYAGEPFGAGLPEGGFALMVCYGSHDGKLKGVWFKNISGEDIGLLRKYGKYALLHITGQAMVSEAVDGLDFYVDGKPVSFEEFEREWKKEFPRYDVGLPVPTQPGYYKKAHTFTITKKRTPTPPEASLRNCKRSAEDIGLKQINELRFFVNGKEVLYEEFEKEWVKEFSEPVPKEPLRKTGKKHVFIITWHGAGPTELQQSLKSIEEKLKEALADEDRKAIPFYHALIHRIEEARNLIPGRTQHEKEKDRYLYAMLYQVKSILTDEQKHSDKIVNMIAAIRELERVLGIERAGKQHVLRPLEMI